MQIKEIQEYSEIRAKARAYLCYITGRNISNTIQNGDIQTVLSKLDALNDSIPHAEAVYALDVNGVQMIANISDSKTLRGIGKNANRSDRAYYYKTVKEHRCTLTEPYPSHISNTMVVTSAFPIYDEQDNLLCIICVDISLSNILRMVHPSSVDSFFGTLSKLAYTSFSIALSAVSLLLFVKGVDAFLHFGIDLGAIDTNEIFKATILLTLSIAIFDLVKAIFEEEVLGKEKKEGAGDGHQTMIRFLGSIIIALSIEALMLVFKFALTDPGQLIYAVYLIASIAMLIIGLSIYIKLNQSSVRKNKEIN
ncbi:MAG: N-linked glycosylation glycosyltransferase PglG [uncultured Sulfurovum sp.]|uniref:N-linked glycosylation glycosyltransferase PglG n=1 Tax=uncultured Sulfurovum sp. TaxID=269237 RepID=A0A6S6U0S2_9BACT|nr:MAG: N-linked glycosylation glycosyltransferase PglG [uncultured Sulfurovum sp.]